jgi:hypothetical protein
MFTNKKLLIVLTLSLLAFVFTASAAAKPNEYDAIVHHLQTKYQAKKVSIPFMWLARFGVKIVRPAGFKSFNVTLFQDLKFSRDKLDLEMQEAMKNSFSPEWGSILHVRSRDGQQVYMYMKDAGSNVKLTVVTIDKEQAAVIRATFDADKLAEFINNPKIFGISLDDEKQDNKTVTKPKDDGSTEEKKDS